MTPREKSSVVPGAPFRTAMSSLIYDRWQDVWKALPVAIEGSDPEGVHDMRVASRRVRAAMDVAVDAFPSSWYAPLHKTAKRITNELGEVRDRDVQIAYFAEYREGCDAGDRPGVDALIARLTGEQSAARESMLVFLARLEERGVREEIERRFSPEREGNESDS